MLFRLVVSGLRVLGLSRYHSVLNACQEQSERERQRERERDRQQTDSQPAGRQAERERGREQERHRGGAKMNLNAPSILTVYVDGNPHTGALGTIEQQAKARICCQLFSRLPQNYLPFASWLPLGSLGIASPSQARPGFRAFRVWRCRACRI